jgi:hypothetical protein
VTGNYAHAASSYPDHYNRFLVGTVWEDLDADGLYDPGEGIPDVKVEVTPGAWFAVTAAGGGYALPVEAAGPVDVVFSGGGVGAAAVHTEIGSESVLLDYAVSAVVPEPGAASGGLLALLALAGLARPCASRLGAAPARD